MPGERRPPLGGFMRDGGGDKVAGSGGRIRRQPDAIGEQF
jgi:hypothetical protein